MEYFEKIKQLLKEYSTTIEIDGKNVSVEISGSGKRAIDLETGDKYIKIDGKWYNDNFL